jgi:hypothetical protein
MAGTIDTSIQRKRDEKGEKHDAADRNRIKDDGSGGDSASRPREEGSREDDPDARPKRS